MSIPIRRILLRESLPGLAVFLALAVHDGDWIPSAVGALTFIVLRIGFEYVAARVNEFMDRSEAAARERGES